MGLIRSIVALCFLCVLQKSAGQTGPAGVQTSATCVFWVKADVGTSSTTNNTPISYWNDQSGNGINTTQSTSAAQPSFATNVMNGFPAIQFDNVNGNNDKLTAADNSLLDNTTGYTFFMLVRPQVLDGSARCIVSKRTNVGVDQSFMHFFYTSNRLYTDIQTTNDRYSTASAFSANTNYLITQQYDGTLATASRCRSYIGSALNVTSSESSSSIPDNSSPLLIGSTDANDPRPFGGYIAEVIVYRTALQSAERTIVENYLSAKYDVALSANDKYVGDNSANGNYDYDVAGVGQESTGSSSSFSPSISGGLGIRINSGLDNGDYLLAGHASLVNSILTTDVAGFTGTNKSRWERTWYLDVTNTSTSLNADLIFDFSAAGLTAPTLGLAQDYVLLYRASNSGNWSEVSTASLIIGDNIVFSGLTITNDGYYTLGTKNYFASPLPITLSSFTAEYKNRLVEINWTTTLEKNVLGFDILSAEADGEFSHFTSLAPKGGEHQTTTYSVEDTRTIQSVRYYKLRSNNKDGSVDYSSTIAISALWHDLSVFPCPAENRIELQGLYMPDVTFALANSEGKILATESAWEIKSSTRATLDISGLSAGVYVLTLYYQGQIRVEKLIVK